MFVCWCSKGPQEENGTEESKTVEDLGLLQQSVEKVVTFTFGKTFPKQNEICVEKVT